MKPNNNAITLVELIISILLLGMVVLGMFSIDLFSREQFLSTDKRVKLQNEAVYVLSHMSKQLSVAIGDVGDVDNWAVAYTYSSGKLTSLSAKTDSNANGKRDAATDIESRYCLGVTTCNNPSAPANTLYFNNKMFPAPVSAPEVLSSRVTSLAVVQSGNCLNINITLCYNPTQVCGTLNNPRFNMESSIKMPSVSVQ